MLNGYITIPNNAKPTTILLVGLYTPTHSEIRIAEKISVANVPIIPKQRNRYA